MLSLLPVAPALPWHWSMLSSSYIHLPDHLVCNHWSVIICQCYRPPIFTYSTILSVISRSLLPSVDYIHTIWLRPCSHFLVIVFLHWRSNKVSSQKYTISDGHVMSQMMRRPRWEMKNAYCPVRFHPRITHLTTSFLVSHEIIDFRSFCSRCLELSSS